MKLILLKFGEESEAEEQVVETVKEKINCRHDVLRDPLLEKGVEKFDKEQANQKIRSWEWAGKSLAYENYV